VQCTEVGIAGLRQLVLRGLFLYFTPVGTMFLQNVAVCHSTRLIILHALPLHKHSCGNLNPALSTVHRLADGRQWHCYRQWALKCQISQRRVFLRIWK